MDELVQKLIRLAFATRPEHQPGHERERRDQRLGVPAATTGNHATLGVVKSAFDIAASEAHSTPISANDAFLGMPAGGLCLGDELVKCSGSLVPAAFEVIDDGDDRSDEASDGDISDLLRGGVGLAPKLVPPLRFADVRQAARQIVHDAGRLRGVDRERDFQGRLDIAHTLRVAEVHPRGADVVEREGSRCLREGGGLLRASGEHVIAGQVAEYEGLGE